MAELLLTPFGTAPAIDLGDKAGPRLFRKQILPFTQINYNGKKINFDQSYLSGLVKAFKDKAYDQVPFLFADGENRHTMDPSRWRGQLRDAVLSNDGLDGIFELTEDAADLVEKNPNFGVSARIVMDHERADGMKWPRALQHVLGTLDPRVTGMRPWEAVSLSTDAGDLPVTDLSASIYQGESMSTQTEDISAEELQAALEALTEDAEDAEDEELIDQLDDEEDSDDEADEDEDDEEDDEDDDSEEETKLSNEGPSTVDLAAANSVLAEQLSVVQNKLAETEWEAKRGEFERDGVPPALLDLAAPVLSRPRTEVIELSNGKRTDSAKVIEALLDASRGFLDLSGPAGSSVDGGGDTDEVLEAYEKSFPLD